MYLLSRYQRKDFSNGMLLLFVPFFVLSLLYVKTESFRYVSIILLIIPLIFTFFGKKVKFRTKYAVLASFFVLQFFVSLLHTSLIQTIKNSAQYFINLSPIFIYDFVLKQRRSKCTLNTYGFVLSILLLTVAFCVISSIYYVQSRPYALRDLSIYDPTKGDDSKTYFVSIGGGYPLLFSLLLFIPYLVFKIRFNAPKALLRVLLAIASILIIVYLFIVAGVTTCVFVAFIAVFLSLFAKAKKKIAITLMVICSLIVLLFIFVPNLLEGFINVLAEPFKGNVIIYTRLKEIAPTLYLGERTSSFGMRVNCLLKDFRTIARYPLFGAGLEHGFDYLSLAEYVGWHSEWFDILAEFGLVAGGMLLFFMFKSFKEVFDGLKNKTHKKIYLISGVVTLLMGFLDPILTTNMFLVLFVLLPLTFSIEESKQGMMYEEKTVNCFVR